MDLLHELAQKLAARTDQRLTRQRQIINEVRGARLKIDGHSFLSFSSNDYLGLRQHPAVIAAAQRSAARYGVGAGASHLLGGHVTTHHQLEKKLADFVGCPRALLFSCGYMANLGIATALLSKGDAVFADRLNHASLNDAALLSRAKLIRYPHLDMSKLERLLKSSSAKTKLVLSDAVFSMDGDIAPLADLINLCERHDAWLLIDDAHGFGVLGEEGRGILSHYKTHSPRIIYMATLGKAMGVAGAFVAGEADIIEALIQFARTYIYTTALPPLLVSAVEKSVELLEEESWHLQHLHKAIAYFTGRLVLQKWRVLPSQTAIQAIVLGESAAALEVSRKLFERGLIVPAIRPPTVPQGTARLRVSLSAAHSIADLDLLISALEEIETEQCSMSRC